jgi:hypothetical protein
MYITPRTSTVYVAVAVAVVALVLLTSTSLTASVYGDGQQLIPKSINIWNQSIQSRIPTRKKRFFHRYKRPTSGMQKIWPAGKLWSRMVLYQRLQ